MKVAMSHFKDRGIDLMWLYVANNIWIWKQQFFNDICRITMRCHFNDMFRHFFLFLPGKCLIILVLERCDFAQRYRHFQIPLAKWVKQWHKYNVPIFSLTTTKFTIDWVWFQLVLVVPAAPKCSAAAAPHLRSSAAAVRSNAAAVPTNAPWCLAAGPRKSGLEMFRVIFTIKTRFEIASLDSFGISRLIWNHIPTFKHLR